VPNQWIPSIETFRPNSNRLMNSPIISSCMASGKANGLPHQPFALGAEREMFLFLRLRQLLADHLVSRSRVPRRGTPALSVEAAHIERGSPRSQYQPCLILTPTEDRGDPPARLLHCYNRPPAAPLQVREPRDERQSGSLR